MGAPGQAAARGAHGPRSIDLKRRDRWLHAAQDYGAGTPHSRLTTAVARFPPASAREIGEEGGLHLINECRASRRRDRADEMRVRVSAKAHSTSGFADGARQRPPIYLRRL